ncbi:MAG: hypothetical protein ACI391_00075 [Muribaculaceae bacterium]
MKFTQRVDSAVLAILIALLMTVAMLWPTGPTMLSGALFCVLPYVIGRMVLHGTAFDNRTSRYVLMGGWFAVSLGSLINVWYYTTASGGTCVAPVFENYDSIRDWGIGTQLLAGEAVYGAYGYLVAGLRWLLGDNVLSVIGFNVLSYLVCAILTGQITYELTGKERTSRLAMLLTIMIAYLWAQATTVLKDTPVAMCMAILTLIFVRSEMKRARVWEYVCGAIVLALMAVIRVNFLFMISAMAVVMGVHRRRFSPVMAAVVALCAIYYLIVSQLLIIAPDPLQIAHTTGPVSDWVMADDHTRPWDDMLGGSYSMLPMYKRLLWLPASVVLQFILPFPWNFESAYLDGPAKVMARIGLVWYYCGALILWWLAVKWRTATAMTRRTVLCGLLLTVATAYSTSGRASRYCLSYLPMLLPIAAMAHECWRERTLQRWLIVFGVLLMLALIICYQLHKPWI